MVFHKLASLSTSLGGKNSKEIVGVVLETSTVSADNLPPGDLGNRINQRGFVS
jgi:hypothetical protein